MVVRVVTFHSVGSRVEIGVFLLQVFVYEIVQPIDDFPAGDPDTEVRGKNSDTPGENAGDDLDFCQTRVRRR